MPTFRIGEYLFRFYSSDGVGPPHIHILRDSCEAKVWLNPVALQHNRDTLRGNWERYSAFAPRMREGSWRHGMATSESSSAESEVTAVDAELSEKTLRVQLSDGRIVEIGLDRPWLHWLRDATDAQRRRWRLEPGGFAIYWDELDGGVEVRHLLSLTPVA
jgi:hypothetical protein